MCYMNQDKLRNPRYNPEWEMRINSHENYPQLQTKVYTEIFHKNTNNNVPQY